MGLKSETMERGLERLVEGGDERITLSNESNRRNRYNLNPLDPEDLLYRGSCTCGVLTPDTLSTSLKQAQEWSLKNEDDWAEAQRQRLRHIAGVGQDVDVWFGPSGTDLLYFPLLLARAKSNRPLLNVLSCPEELGSGSRLAVAGRAFSTRTALGGTQEKGQPIHPAMVGEVVELKARNEDGSIRNRKADIEQLIEQNTDRTLIIHLVYGSKSGIKDDLEVIAAHPNVHWTVDLCQFRADPDLIGNLLGRGAMVLVTGSKFYQAPPFCGALLVPSGYRQVAQEGSLEGFTGLKDIMARSDIPPHLEAIRKHLPAPGNASSRWRWECALHEMEACHQVPREDLDGAIAKWSQSVTQWLGEHDVFELMPDQAKTNDSIVSFRVKVAGTYFGDAAIRALFNALTTRDWTAELGHRRVFIGQPVCYGDRWFIRLALGSSEARAAVLHGNHWEADRQLVGHIAALAKQIAR